MTILHYKMLTREGSVFGQWLNSSTIHNNIGSLIHKKCHPKIYHSDTDYHMTLNIIFSVVSMHTKEYDIA